MNIPIPQVPNPFKNNELLSNLTIVTSNTHFRAINKVSGYIRSLYGTYNQLHSELTKLNNEGYCIFFTVSETDSLGAKTENITAMRALFIDLDDNTVNNKLIIESLPVTPSIAIETSFNKYHVYWTLNKPDSRIELFKPLQKQLAEKFNSDKNVSDLARVMRLPNFYHMKDITNPFLTKVTINNNVKYDLDSLIDMFDLSVSLPTNKIVPMKTDENGVCSDNPTARERLISFVNRAKSENIPTSGVNGNTKLTQIFAPMARDLGLPLNVAQELFWENLNPICIPPWGEDEKGQFFTFIENGYALCQNDFGCLTAVYAFRDRPVSEPTGGWAENAKLAPILEIAKYNAMPPIVQITSNSNKGLKQFTLNGASQQMKKQMLDDKFVLKDIAILGQLTVFYAAPNAGKTLLTMKLLMESVESGVIKGENIYYINADDTYNDSVMKLGFLERFNIGMIIPDIVKSDFIGEKSHSDTPRFKASQLAYYLETMIENKDAKNKIVILDTLKKFADLMDKKGSTEFSKVLRRFSTNGGTVIALAHVNKQSDSKGKKIHAGTTDILEDFDCSYIIENDGELDSIKRVKFTCEKGRGNTKKELYFTYSVADGVRYEDLLNSVKCVDNPKVSSANDDDNSKVIRKTHVLIDQDVKKKTDLVNQLHSVLKPELSKAKITAILELNEGKEWAMDKGKNNTHIYSSLLPKPATSLVL
jgi:archaellum biogenesis ATPase FlaH